MSTSLSSDNVNHDIKKAKKRKALEKKFSAKQIAIRLSSCNPKEAEVYFKEILSYAREVAAEPVYDPQLLNRCNNGMLLGFIILIVGIILCLTIGTTQPTNLLMNLQQLAIATLTMVGCFLLYSNYQNKKQTHLPEILTPEIVRSAIKLLEDTLEIGRSFPSVTAQRLIMFTAYLDAAVLLWLVVPTLLRTQTPLVHIAICFIGALMVGGIMQKLIGYQAVELRKFDIRRIHNRLRIRGADKDNLHAKAIHRQYDRVMRAEWPEPVTSKDLFTASFISSGLLLASIILMMACLRIIFGEGDPNDAVVLGVAGFVVVLSTVLAIKQRADMEALDRDIAIAHRIVAIFPSEEAFIKHCERWQREIKRFVAENVALSKRKIARDHYIEPIEFIDAVDVTPASFKPSPSRISASGFSAKSAPLPGSATSYIPPKSSSGFTGKTTGFKPKIK